MIAALVAGVLVPKRAAAEVHEVAARVAEQWKAAGAKTFQLPTRFLFDDETIAIAVPEDRASCMHIALFGSRGMSFRARLSGAGLMRV